MSSPLQSIPYLLEHIVVDLWTGAAQSTGQRPYIKHGGVGTDYRTRTSLALEQRFLIQRFYLELRRHSRALGNSGVNRLH